MTMQSYKILRNSNSQELEEEVNHYLAEGWKLWGGVAVDSENFELFQAMVKEGEIA